MKLSERIRNKGGVFTAYEWEMWRQATADEVAQLEAEKNILTEHGTVMLKENAELKRENKGLKEFEGDDPVKLLRLCATTMDDWSSWDNSIVRARANWLRRFASYIALLADTKEQSNVR